VAAWADPRRAGYRSAAMRPLRVCIDARLSGAQGGVEQVVIGVAGALSRLDDGNEEYRFLVEPGHEEWLRPYVPGDARSKLMTRGDFPTPRGLAARVKWQFEARVPRLFRRHWPPPAAGYDQRELRLLGVSDGTIEIAAVDVMHFLNTDGFLTKVPSIYNPHDLQHLHFPEFFTTKEIERRELTYRTYVDQAELSVMMTSWGKDDLVSKFGVPPDNVAVVPWASVLASYPAPSDSDLAALRDRLNLPEKFVLFPAQTWEHKNHLRFLDALAILRDKHGLEVTAVCPGKHSDHFPEVERRLRDLGLADVTQFPGFVSPLELRSLYTLATALVFPSLFEGWGLPVSEAFWIGLPVACSAIPSLVDVAGDAALTFDPHSPEQIADSVMRLWNDPPLRESLAEKGKKRAGQFSFDNTARLFRAHYRRIAGRRLSSEDRDLLAAAPLT
jgi:glycosyltransferase involved in cell wall biosynthesis